MIAEAWERAVLTGTDINGALLQMAKEGGLKVNTVREAKNSADFFREDATRPKIIVDKGIGDDHGSTRICSRTSSLIARCARRAARERGRAARAVRQGQRPDAGRRDPARRPRLACHLRRRGPGHINDPETLREALRPTGFR